MARRHRHSTLLLHLILTSSNQFMKVQLAKMKADQEKSGKKSDHKVSTPLIKLTVGKLQGC